VDVPAELKELSATLVSIESVLDLDTLRGEVSELEAQASVPDLWDDPEKAQQVNSRLSYAQGEVRRVEDIRRRLDDAQTLWDLAEEMDDPDSRTEAEGEVAGLRKAIDELEVRTLLSGEYDSREALMTIRSEAGGVDAADFAEMLMRMYLRWAERHNYPVDVLDTSYAEEAGIKSATFQVKTPYAYGTLSVEQGTEPRAILRRVAAGDDAERRALEPRFLELRPDVVEDCRGDPLRRECGDNHRHQPAERSADEDRPVDRQLVEQLQHVAGIGRRDIALRPRVAVAVAAAAIIEHDNAAARRMALGQRREIAHVASQRREAQQGRPRGVSGIIAVMQAQAVGHGEKVVAEGRIHGSADNARRDFVESRPERACTGAAKAYMRLIQHIDGSAAR